MQKRLKPILPMTVPYYNKSDIRPDPTWYTIHYFMPHCHTSHLLAIIFAATNVLNIKSCKYLNEVH